MLNRLRWWNNRDLHGRSIGKGDGESDLSHRFQTSFLGRDSDSTPEPAFDVLKITPITLNRKRIM